MNVLCIRNMGKAALKEKTDKLPRWNEAKRAVS